MRQQYATLGSPSGRYTSTLGSTLSQKGGTALILALYGKETGKVACVKRGSECNTDHQLLRIKIRVKGKGGYCQLRNKVSKKFAVSRFMSRGGANSGADMYRDAYREHVSSKAVEVWKDEGTVEEKWSAIRSALVEAGKEVLGQERQHPDWFRESSEILEPLFQRRDLLYTKWLSSGHAVDHRKYLKSRQDARKAVRNAKDTWFKRKADEAQESRFGVKKVWRCIHDIQ